MKKLIFCCLLFFTAVSAHAETCPANPSGYIFRVAAWGDHKKSVDNVRCYYYSVYDETKSVILTSNLIPESAITSHPEWSNENDHYHLCVSRSDNIYACPFN